MSAVARRYYERGKTALDAGDFERAVEFLRAAVDLAPGFATARMACAVALARYGDAPRASQLLRNGVGRAVTATTRGAIYATLGDVLLMGGDFHGAREAFEQAARAPGFEVRVAAGMARVHARLGDHGAAVESLRRAARLSSRG